MTERTINEAELKEALSTTALIIGCPTYNSIIKNAFPPPFTPKEGEVILASNDEDFPVHLFVEFAHMNKLNKYVCHHKGGIRAFSYAHPQTRTHKGEG
jgi:hypothetical protein